MKAKPNPALVLNARKQLLDFWDVLPIHPNFSHVNKKEFREIPARAKGQKRAKKMPDVTGLGRFRSLGTPPPPSLESPPAEEDAGGASPQQG